MQFYICYIVKCYTFIFIFVTMLQEFILYIFAPSLHWKRSFPILYIQINDTEEHYIVFYNVCMYSTIRLRLFSLKLLYNLTVWSTLKPHILEDHHVAFQSHKSCLSQKLHFHKLWKKSLFYRWVASMGMRAHSSEHFKYLSLYFFLTHGFYQVTMHHIFQNKMCCTNP